MVATFIPNPAGIKLLAISPEMRINMRRIADEGADYAVSISPVLSGKYRASLFAADAGPGEAAVASDDTGAIAIEKGDGQTREGFYVLARTISWIESS